MWLSLVERLLWEQDAAGSNPVIRTNKQKWLHAVSAYFLIKQELVLNAATLDFNFFKIYIDRS